MASDSIENIVPYFGSLGSLLFSTNNVKLCKNADFFLAHPFQIKLLFFQIIVSAKRTFAAMAGSGKPIFLHMLFPRNEKQNSRKNYTVMFSH